MLLQALEVALHRLADIRGRLGARAALGNAAGQSGTRRHEDAVLVLLQVNTVLHYPAFYQSDDGGARRERCVGRFRRIRLGESAGENIYILRDFCDCRFLGRKGA